MVFTGWFSVVWLFSGFFVCTLCGDFEHPARLAFFGKHLPCALFFGKVSGVNSVLFLTWFLFLKVLPLRFFLCGGLFCFYFFWCPTFLRQTFFSCIYCIIFSGFLSIFQHFFNLSSMFDGFLACICCMLCEYLRGVSKELRTVQNGFGAAF